MQRFRFNIAGLGTGSSLGAVALMSLIIFIFCCSSGFHGGHELLDRIQLWGGAAAGVVGFNWAGMKFVDYHLFKSAEAKKRTAHQQLQARARQAGLPDYWPRDFWGTP